MKGSKGGGAIASSGSLATPAIVVLLVLILGATIYLWRARYIRRRTAYVLMVVIVLALAGVATWMYTNPMQDLG